MKLKISISKGRLMGLAGLFLLFLASVIVAQNELIFEHTWDEVEGTIPPGFCVLTQEISECPNGLVKNDALDHKLFRLSNTGDLPGEGSGSLESYSFTFKFYRSDTSKDHAGLRNIWIDDKEASNAHKAKTTYTLDNWPPYRTIMACCRLEEES